MLPTKRLGITIFRGNRSQIVKQIGNAVPPLLGRAIATALLAQW